MTIASAILLVFALYLIDKHNRWREAFKVVAYLLALGVFILAAVFIWSFIDESGGIVAAVHRVPWWAYYLGIIPILVLVGVMDNAENKKIKAGDPVAIAKRIDDLMQPPFNYTRLRAEETIYQMRFGKKS